MYPAVTTSGTNKKVDLQMEVAVLVWQRMPCPDFMKKVLIREVQEVPLESKKRIRESSRIYFH